MRIAYASLPAPDTAESDRYLIPPLAAGCLAAYARSQRGGKDRHILLPPQQFAGGSPLAIADKILSTQPQLAAISVYNWNRALVMQVAHLLREENPKLIVVLGGPEVAFDPASALRESGADWVCTGEGELAFTALLSRLEAAPDDLSALPGMLSRLDREHSTLAPAPLVNNLDDIPSPYNSGILIPQPGSTVDLETMRGCPFNCNFCLYGKNYGQVRFYSLDRVKADLSCLIQSEAASIYIIDPTFNLPRQRCLEICAVLKELNLHKGKKIFVEVKAEYIDETMADAFADAGIAAVEVGLQSTNPAALALMGRSFDPARFAAGMRLLREREIWANVGVIAGLPGDSAGNFKDTLRFVSDQALGRLLIYPLQVFPGCAFHRDADQLGLKFDPSPTYQVIETPHISAKELRGIIDSIPDLVEEMNQPYMREMSRMVLSKLRARQASTIANPVPSGTVDQNEGG